MNEPPTPRNATMILLAALAALLAGAGAVAVAVILALDVLG